MTLVSGRFTSDGARFVFEGQRSDNIAVRACHHPSLLQRVSGRWSKALVQIGNNQEEIWVNRKSLAKRIHLAISDIPNTLNEEVYDLITGRADEKRIGRIYQEHASVLRLPPPLSF
jgi:hypothetical protein